MSGKKNTKRPIFNDDDSDQDQTECGNRQMKYNKTASKRPKNSNQQRDSNSKVHEENRKLNQKRRIPNLVDVLVQDTDDDSGMLTVIALQAQLDGIKDIIMKTLEKGKQKGSSINVEDNSGRSREQTTGSSKNIEYAQGSSKGKNKISSSRKVSKSKELKTITDSERKRKDVRERSRERKRKDVRRGSRSRDFAIPVP